MLYLQPVSAAPLKRSKGFDRWNRVTSLGSLGDTQVCMLCLHQSRSPVKHHVPPVNAVMHVLGGSCSAVLLSLASYGRHAWAPPQICHNSRQAGTRLLCCCCRRRIIRADVFHSTTRWRFAPRYNVGTAEPRANRKNHVGESNQSCRNGL